MNRSLSILVTCGLALSLTACHGNGKYTAEQANAAKDKLGQLKSGLEFQTAMGDFLAGDFGKANAAVDRSIALNDKVARTWVLKGRIQLETGNLEGALVALSKAETLDAKSVDAQYFLGLVNERLERKDEALKRFQAAADLDRANPQYAIAAAETLIDLGRRDEAKAYLEGRGAQLANNAALRQTLGHIAMMDEKPDKAAELFNEARLLAPNDNGILEDLVRAQVIVGRFADAEVNLQKLVKDPVLAKRRDLLLMRARCLTQIERIVDAREILIKLCNDTTGSADIESWNDLGHVSYLLNDLSRVRQASAKLIAIAPKLPEGYVLRAMWEQKRGDARAAKDSVTKAISLKQSPDSYLLLATIQQELKDTDGARSALANALKLNPNNNTAKQLLDQLNNFATVTPQ